MKIFQMRVMFSLMCFSISFSNAQTPLQKYIDTAVMNNPTLKVYQFQSDAMEQKISPAKQLDDPMLMVGVMNLPVNFSFTQDMRTIKQIGVQQKFSVTDKYSLRGEVKQNEFEGSVFDAQAQQLALTYKVKHQYYDLYANKKGIETTEQSIVSMKNYLTIANDRYSLGLASQQDVLKAELGILKMQNELIKMRSMQDDEVATFNTLLYRVKDAEVILPDTLHFKIVELPMDSLMNALVVFNPMILSSKKMVSADSADYLLAKTTKVPEFNVGAYYEQRSALMPNGMKARDMLSVSVGMNLPVFMGKKQNPLIEESKIQIDKSDAMVDAMQNEMELMLHHAWIDANKNAQLISLYEEQLIPIATQNVSAGILSYQKSKIDFMTLTDNFLSLYNYRLQYQQAIADYLKALVQIETLTGKKLITE